ncbi:MAG: 50S ribosomal protein L30 [Lagierella massiliensis]|nr:50S ribosomal protein L30 [Lagierella massiliensis]
MSKLKITLKRSTIGRVEKHKRAIKTLGLAKVGSSVIREDNPAIRGVLNKVGYMIDVEEVE